MAWNPKRLAVWGAVLSLVVLAGAPAARSQPLQRIALDGAVVAPAPVPGKSVKPVRGLHIPQGRRVNFNYYMTDGAGFRWDIQHYGTVGQGTNNAFSGGMYCQVNGSNVRSTGFGWVNSAGDEIEIGPRNSHNLQVYRRIKVYRDTGLARWLDIFENPTGQNITVQIASYTNRCYTIRNTVTGSGQGGLGTFGAKDSALITETTGGNCPVVLHIVCDKRSKVRPAVQIRSSQVYLRYNLTIPAGKTVILCHFLSQGHSTAAHLKTLKTFRAHAALKDLSPGVRKLIVNFAGGGGFEGVDLTRSATTDTVVLKTGDPIHGTITNEQFTIRAFFGEVSVPAEQVIGMAAGRGPGEQMRFAMVGGQIISGEAGETKLNVTLPAGGALTIPLEDIGQWSYRITEARPESTAFSQPVVLLRTGDKLAFDPSGLKLQFRTRYGMVPLDPSALLEISLDNRNNAVHRAVFLNGSRLGGFLEPQHLRLDLKLGRALEIPRSKIIQMRFAAAEKPDDKLTSVLLKNEDELFGRVLAERILLVTPYNPISLVPENVRTIRRNGRTEVQMWDGTVHKGRLPQAEIAFQIVPGPELALHPAQLTQIVRPRPLPPEDTQKLVEELVARLGAESYKDRQEATEKLMKIRGIRALLEKHLNHSDPEVRQRIEEILAKAAEAEAPPRPARPGQPPAQVWIRN